MAAPKKFLVRTRAKADGVNVTYYARFTAQPPYGRQEFPLGSSPDWDLARAEQALKRIKADVERGVWKPKARTPKPTANSETLRFDDMAYDWWDNKIAGRRKAVRTQKAYRPELELHLLPFFGGMAVKDISRRDVDAFVQQQIKKGLAPSYINSHLQRLGQILDLAMDWYQTPPVLLENPAKGKARRVENPNTPDADRWLEPDQVELLLHAARKLNEGAPQTRVSRAGKTYTLRPRADYLRLGRESIVAGLCFSGLRNTELCDLTWARIDFARRLIRPGGTKTRAAGRDVNITDGLLPYLIAHRNQAPFSGQGDPVWPTATGRARNKDNLNRRILQPVVEKARELIAADAEHSLRTGEPRRLDVVLPDSITAHTFRRTFCGFTTEVERDPAYAQAQLGHADPKFTQRVYNRVKSWSGEPDARVVAWMQRPTREAPASRLRLAE